MAELDRHCLCGGSIRGTAGAGLAAALEAAFDGEHTGEGHEPATAAHAAAARRRYDIVIIEEPNRG